MDFPYNIIYNNNQQDYSQRVTYKVTTDSVTEPVTLAAAKLHLKMDDIDAEDTLIDSLIIAARMFAENFTNRAFVTKTITQVYNEFPSSDKVLRLAVTPLQAVVSVNYNDENGAAQTWAASDYIVDAYTEPSEISVKNSISFPSTIDEKNAVTVIYTAGYGTADDVPQPIKQAILLLIGHFYNHREDTVSEKRTAAERLLKQYRVSRN
jgi:uncharacterized phiE125 gp8 family phage protein